MASRVLYIEDNKDNLVLVRRILRAAGYEMLEAMSAQEGLQIAEQQVPDLILIDINMPDMDGLAATGHLRRIPALAHVPIVALTANVMRGMLEQTQAAGCDGYIAKPIEVDRFPGLIEGFLKNGRSV